MDCNLEGSGDLWGLLWGGDIIALWTALFCSIVNWLQGLITGLVDG